MKTELQKLKVLSALKLGYEKLTAKNTTEAEFKNMEDAIEIVKNCSIPDVSGCTCAIESTDVYDDNQNYLGYVCLGCGYFSKY